jgi:hypothetical protein
VGLDAVVGDPKPPPTTCPTITIEVGTVSVFFRVIVRLLLAGTVITGGAQAPLLFSAAHVAFPVGRFAGSQANPHIGTVVPSGRTVLGYRPAVRFTVWAGHTAAARRRMVTANAALFRVAFIKVDCIFLSLLTELR